MSRQVSYERIIGGRYALYGPIASGGMAHVHFGRLLGTAGFARTVAIKRLRGELLESPEFVSTLLDEARLASRIRHPNVVATLDMVAEDDEVFLVMEYVVGESLSRLLTRCRETQQAVPLPVAAGMLVGVLHALHAAHEARDEEGEPMGIVHRDVSPQNVLVGTDGMARLLDFGVAKGKGRLQTTRAGQLKGKVGYMSPEQILGEEPDRRSDVYAAAVLLWEVLTGERLFPSGDSAANNFSLIPKILEADMEPPSVVRDTVPKKLDAIVMRGLNRARDARYESAREFAVALEDTVSIATPRRIGEWVEQLAAVELAQRAELLGALERASHDVDHDSQAVVDTTVKRRRRKRLASLGSEADEVRDDATVEDGATGEGRLAALLDETSVDEPSVDEPADDEPTHEPADDEPTHEPSTLDALRRTRVAGSDVKNALADAARRVREDDPSSTITKVKRASAAAAALGAEPQAAQHVARDGSGRAERFADDEGEDETTAVATTLKSRVEELQRERLERERLAAIAAGKNEAVVRPRRDVEPPASEKPEPKTSVYGRKRELKGPPGLPGHETLERESPESLAESSKASSKPTSAAPSSLPADLQLPVQSYRWLWVVLAAVLVGLAILAFGLRG